MTNNVDKIRGGEGSKNNSFQPLILAFVLVLGVFLGRYITGDSRMSASGSDSTKIIDLINRIDEKYVDEVNKEELVENAIETILQDLDPHSYYINYDDYLAVQESMQGNFEGIGVEFMINDDTLQVVATIEGGPAGKVGLRAGDKIINVDGKALSGTDISNADVTEALKGPKGTKVTVSILRKGEDELLDFEIIRDQIPINSVVAKFMYDDEVGYIKVNRFAATTAWEFAQALTELKAKGMKDLILDLRGNGGGYLDAATSMVGHFLGKKELIVYTEGRNSEEDETFTDRAGQFQDVDLVVLINQSSASASEIVAGALQDHDKAITVGRRSFGKGLVQNELQLNDGSVVRLTVARYFTPSGRCIQKPYGDGIDYDGEYVDRYHNGELMNADSIVYADSLMFKTDMGRTVYGGGGISPDVFVPMDTVGLSDYFRSLSYGGIFRNFGFNHVDANRDLYRYDSYVVFDNEFEVSDELMNEMIEYAERESIEFDQEDFDYSKELIALRLKGEIGKNLFDDQARYYINLADDADFKEGLRVIKNYDAHVEQWIAELEK